MNYFRHQTAGITFLCSETESEVLEHRMQARLRDAIGIIRAVPAYMIGLTEKPFPLAFPGYGIITERLCRNRLEKRDLEDGPTTGSEYAADLPHGLDVVLHMLKHMIAEHHIEGAVRKRHLMDIHVHLGPRRFKIRRDIPVTMLTGERSDEALLRCDMKHIQITLEKTGMFMEIPPDQPVSLK